MIMTFSDIGYKPDIGEFIYLKDLMYVVTELDCVNQTFVVEYIG